jgi:hypothetical protein
MTSTEKHTSVKGEEVENVPSHNTEGDYAILMETNGEEYESWYYFLKVKGNEENLKHLQSQLDKGDWYILDDLSTFDLELDKYVSATTAKEMTKVDLNSNSFHRKFDGRLKKIDFDFKKKDGNETRICKVFDVLGYGQIDDYISDEDIDDEDLVTDDESTDNESVSESSSSEEESEDERKDLRKKRIPPSLAKNNKK